MTPYHYLLFILVHRIMARPCNHLN